MFLFNALTRGEVDSSDDAAKLQAVATAAYAVPETMEHFVPTRATRASVDCFSYSLLFIEVATVTRTRRFSCTVLRYRPKRCASSIKFYSRICSRQRAAGGGGGVLRDGHEPCPYVESTAPTIKTSNVCSYDTTWRVNNHKTRRLLAFEQPTTKKSPILTTHHYTYLTVLVSNAFREDV